MWKITHMQYKKESNYKDRKEFKICSGYSICMYICILCCFLLKYLHLYWEKKKILFPYFMLIGPVPFIDIQIFVSIDMNVYDLFHYIHVYARSR